MKKKILIVLAIVLILATVVCCVACSKESADKMFGEFSYNGKYLKDYAKEAIDAKIAIQITQNFNLSAPAADEASLSSNPLVGMAVNDTPLATNSEEQLAQAQLILKKYAGCTIKTYYYVESEEEKQVKQDFITATDFKAMLENNQFTPFSQLVAKNLIVFEALIKQMEEQNEAFHNDPESAKVPFKDLYTYHKDASDNLVIQTHNFAEIPASIAGGIGCSYRQDSEIVYDSEGKVKIWQTSLGIYSAAPQGTMKQGYILSMSFDWTEKQ